MLLSETLLVMDTRQIAGSLIRDEIARQGATHQVIADRMHAAKSTLARAVAGDARVTDLTLRQVEGALNLPRRLLTFVIAGDATRIERLDMDADLKRHVLEALSEADGTVRQEGSA